MFIDKVSIKIKAGNGGNGCNSFLHDAHSKYGGPNGGNGGRGGNIVFIGDKDINNLIAFHYKRKYFAQNGEKGTPRNSNGSNGEDLYISVPLGTVIKEAETEQVLCDITFDKEEVIILSGGKGGRGNSFFKSATRQAPNFSETGEITKEHSVTLELKTIADVGLVGKPNVGKSTLLSRISNANPKIANYQFTTLDPNLGVVNYYDKSFIVADIPGLIEGASDGLGLGHDFLRHIERTKMIVHVIDIAGLDGTNAYDNYVLINNELAKFSNELANKIQIVALNKCDLLNNDDNINEFMNKIDKSVKVIQISGVTNFGIENLLNEISKVLETLPNEVVKMEIEKTLDVVDNDTIEIFRNDKGEFILSGGKIDQLIRGIILSDNQSFAYFQKRLKNDGIIDMLIEKGMKDGDTVIVKDITFVYEA